MSQGQNSQETADATFTETSKKSEEAKSKNDPDGSSHRRVDRSPQGSAGEDLPGPSSKSKQSAQQETKPESEDSSSFSSLSSYSESSDEEKVSLKEKMKELPPSPPLIQGVNIQSLDPDPILQNEGIIDKANPSLQAKMINADIDHGGGAIHTPGPKDPLHI